MKREAKSLRLYFALYFASLIVIMEVANKKNIPWEKYEIGIGFLVNLLHVKPYISKPNCKIQNWVDFAKVLMATDIFKPYHEIGPSNVRTKFQQLLNATAELPGCFKPYYQEELFLEYLNDIRAEYEEHIKVKKEKKDSLQNKKDEQRSSMVSFEEEFTSSTNSTQEVALSTVAKKRKCTSSVANEIQTRAVDYDTAMTKWLDSHGELALLKKKDEIAENEFRREKAKVELEMQKELIRLANK